MSDSGSAAQMREEWDKLQKQMWSAWSEIQRKATEAMGAEGGTWHEGLELWERTLRGGGSAPGNLVLDKLIEQGKAYLGMAQALAQSARDDQPSASPTELARQWSERMRELLGKGTSGPGEWFAQAFSGPSTDAGLIKLHRLFAQLNPFAESLSGLAKSLSNTPLDELQGWLNVPAFGFTREKQQRQQAMARHLVDYQKASQRYNDLMLRCMQQGLERFEDKLIERSEPGRRIESLRGLYDLWVDAMEEAYAEAALGSEFREVYAELVDAQMRLRQDVQKHIEALTAELGMPTRSEIDSVHRRLHELRRAERARADWPQAAMQRAAELAAEIDALRAELQALRAKVSAGSASAAPTADAPAQPAAAKASRRSTRTTAAKAGMARAATRRRASKEN